MSQYKHDITAVSLETGLSKETIRKWESRYGFPKPQRNSSKERLYSTAQIRSLREASRLINSGVRPKYALLAVAGSNPIEGKPIAKQLQLPLSEEIIAALQRNDRDRVYYLLQRALITHGVIAFIEDTLAKVNHDIGVAWSHGLIKIYQEHLYSDVVQGVLNKETLDIPTFCEGPIDIILATPPGEIHTIGIQMVELWLKFHGIRSLSLGAQVPISELLEASRDIGASVIGISVTSAYALRHSRKFVLDLCSAVPEEMDIWIGGSGAPYKEELPVNVKCFQEIRSLDSILVDFPCLLSVDESPRG
ncbi:cobalamin-dependent protein [Mariprofundus sp. KV]|uniref:MerR family transcriptional regulator n=1 Tax=Mariprofundus sp. KV TaxID=2608715 RepID=UPI0015A238D8|nr:cobalamin-dependent protein [Mariprofundus sp. KV]NWF36215.1 cobalamin B12-binding domain-containing protein [Mariprofundus sp. KV]